jgi:hypothetical protein
MRREDSLVTSLADRDAQAVYADSLLEQGGTAALRGELIQLGLVAKPNAKQRRRTAALAAQLDRAWKPRGAIVERNGGFAVRWRCTPAQLAEHATAAFTDEPLLRALVVAFASRDGLGQSKLMARTAELARVVELELIGHNVRTGRPGPKGLAALLRSPHWPSDLAALRLPTCALGDDGGKLLAKCAALARLHELDLFSNDLQAKTVVAIAGSPHLRELRVLGLEQNKIGLAGVEAIAATKHLTRLERVITIHSWLPPDAVAPIAERFPGALVHTGQQAARRSR